MKSARLYRFLLTAGGVIVAGLAENSRAAVEINEVYPGGGSSVAGTAYTRDFVELFNTDALPVDLSGYRLQYASASGSFTNAVFTFGPGSIIGPADFVTIVTGGAGSAGATLTGTSPDGTNGTTGGASLSATSGAVRLIDASSIVVDLVGYGTAINFEGTVAAAPPSGNAQSINRNAAHTDTNNNAADFAAAVPTPQTGTLSTVVAAPEPAGLGIAAIGGLLLLRRRSRQAVSV